MRRALSAVSMCTAPPSFVAPKTDASVPSSWRTWPAGIVIVAVFGAPPFCEWNVSVTSTSVSSALKIRMSVCQLAAPLLRSATPGTTHFVLPWS